MSHLCPNLSMAPHHTQNKTQILTRAHKILYKATQAHVFDLITILLHVLDTSL